MSYELEVFLWDAKVYGLPSSVDEASDMSVTLESLPSPPTEAMLRFAERVDAAEKEAATRYTNHGYLPEDVRTHDMACLKLELPSDNRHDALRVVGALAQAEGLVGFVEMLGLAFLPDGAILPASRRPVWVEETKPQPKKPASMTYDEFVGFVEAKATEFFCENGFVYGMAPWLLSDFMKMVYQRRHGDITQTIELGYSKGDLQLGGSVTLYSEKVSSIIRMFDIHDKPQNFLTHFSNIVGDYPLYKNKAWRVNALEKALLSLLNSVITWLDKINSVEALAKVMLDECHGDLELRRRKHDFHTVHIPDMAVVCRMVNDPRFEELIVQFDKVRFWGGPELEAKRQTAWPQMLKYLREEYA